MMAWTKTVKDLVQGDLFKLYVNDDTVYMVVNPRHIIKRKKIKPLAVDMGTGYIFDFDEGVEVCAVQSGLNPDTIR